MRFLLLIGVIAVASCDTVAAVTDAAVVVGGCRFPSACMRTTCECTRAGITDCTLCDPVKEPTQACDCAIYDGAAQCATVASLCVGRSPTPCPGAGARCLPASSACNMSGGEPPQLVPGLGDAGLTEPRCALMDDVCCPPPPAPADMSTLDLSSTD